MDTRKAFDTNLLVTLATKNQQNFFNFQLSHLIDLGKHLCPDEIAEATYTTTTAITKKHTVPALLKKLPELKTVSEKSPTTKKEMEDLITSFKETTGYGDTIEI